MLTHLLQRSSHHTINIYICIYTHTYIHMYTYIFMICIHLYKCGTYVSLLLIQVEALTNKGLFPCNTGLFPSCPGLLFMKHSTGLYASNCIQRSSSIQGLFHEIQGSFHHVQGSYASNTAPGSIHPIHGSFS